MKRIAFLSVCYIWLIVVITPPVLGGDWVARNEGLRNLTVNGVTIAPSYPNILYLQARSLGVFKSTDGGLTWSKTATFNSDKGPGYDHLVHQGPAVHPTNPDVVWAASSGQVYKTTNGGSSWSLSSIGTTINGCNGIHGIMVDPNDPDHLIAGTIIAGCDGGVLESNDGGASWTNIAGSNVSGSGVGNDAWPIALDVTDTNRLYCGSPHNSVYRSTNGGSNWINSPPVLGDHSSYEVVINPSDTSEIWCSEVTATWVSDDYGVSWARRTDLFGDRGLKVLRFAPNNANIVYAISSDTIWRSDNNGDTFEARAVVIGGPRCLEIDPTHPDVVYIGTAGLGMFKSLDGGMTFSEINTSLPMTEWIFGRQVFGDPLVPGGMYCVLDGNVIYHWAAGDTQWRYHGVLPGNYLPGIQIERHRPNRWYNASGGLWRSLDSGQTWEEVYTNGIDTSVYGFWLNPRKCGEIILGDRDGNAVMCSDDGSDTWRRLGAVPSFSGYFGGIAGDPFDPDIILVATSPMHHAGGQNGYVWRSTDRGWTWEHISDRMFYGDWRIGQGNWNLSNYLLHQDQPCCCGYHVNLDHHTFGNGTFECRVRISDALDSNSWAGFTIRTATAASDYRDSGWLVYMRRSGVVGLHNKDDNTVINTEQTPIVDDATQWNTIRLVANENTFELYANDTLVGNYTDPSHRFDDPGYFALQTCRTKADFDDLNIQAETTYTDGFDKAILWGGYWGRFVVADPHNPGCFAYTTQWGGMWFSTDHGASWQLISRDDQAGYVFYKPEFSKFYSGNCYVPNGSGYSWRVDNFYNNGLDRQRVGPRLGSSTSMYVHEDWFDPDRLYTVIYDRGISVYEGDDIIGEPAGALPIRLDFDGDGDLDQADFGRLQACLTGPGVPQDDPDCAPARIDIDDDVDSDDVAWFHEYMSGADQLADPSCDCPLGGS